MSDHDIMKKGIYMGLALFKAVFEFKLQTNSWFSIPVLYLVVIFLLT